MKIKLNVPIKEDEIKNIKIGDTVSITGNILTARDKAHKYIYDKLIDGIPVREDAELLSFLENHLHDGIIYHCGPIIKQENNVYTVTSAGPTTSMREEFYMPYIIRHFGLKAVIGKGGMGEATLKAMKKYNCVYLHVVGGSAVKTAQWIKKVVDVKKKDFGTPEAMWLLYVKNFTAYVTMDSYGNSLHDKVKLKSKEIYNSFIW